MNTNNIKITESEIQFHLQNIQSIITRMASNSFAMKNWAVGSVGAILTFLATSDKLCYWWIVIIPWLIFGCLDIYYLYFENCFRDFYTNQNNKHHKGKLQKTELYTVKPLSQRKNLIRAFFSYSILPMYITPILGLPVSYFGNKFIVRRIENKKKGR